MVRGHSIDEHVVDERALEGGEPRVMRLPDVELARVVARDALNRRESVLPGDLDLAHVADVKESGPRTHGHVFVGDAGVLDGHLPAGVRNHAGTRCAMPCV